MKELSLNILDVAKNSVTAGADLITISLETDAEGILVLKIIDDGCGMSEETLRHVTDPFYTTRTTRKVGLGLPLLKLAADNKVEAFIIDMNKRIRVACGEVTITRDDAFPSKYISVLPYGDLARNITEKGFKYEITDVTMQADTSLGISNELTGDIGTIYCEDYIIIMETRD